jgi:flagellin
MEQLSNGKRINSAKDDAAGLAISEKMTSQVRGLNQAIRNANDGISLLQTAEGAMVEITNMMQRMRELAVQSANDTNAQDDRNYLDLEFQQLKTEINRITQNTQWNGMNILDATEPISGAGGGAFTFQVGANGTESHKITHTIDQLTFKAAGLDATAVITNPVSDEATLTIVSGAKGYVVGDVISLKMGSDLLQYKVSQADIDAKDSTDPTISLTAESIAAGILAAFQTAKSQDGRFEGIELAAAATPDETLKITKSDETDFIAGDLTSTVHSGQLADLASLSVKSQSFSDAAIKGLDTALMNINEARAEIGAVINRLNYAVDNLTNVSMNTSESRSRILDTDYAKASAELARTQIISQAATAMLAQANQQPQSVLQLLQG